MINTDENIMLEKESSVFNHNNTASKRTVIPQDFVKNMELEVQDKIKWKMITKDDKKYFIVEKVSIE